MVLILRKVVSIDYVVLRLNSQSHNKQIQCTVTKGTQHYVWRARKDPRLAIVPDITIRLLCWQIAFAQTGIRPKKSLSRSQFLLYSSFLD